MNCWKCGQEIALRTGEKIATRAVCAGCDADLHVCRACRHFDPTRHNECRETQAEWVRAKDRNNYCDYFSPLAGAGAASPRADASSDARKKLDQLFKF